MESDVIEMGGERCVVLGEDGELIRDGDDARGLIEEAMSHRARVIAVPVGRFDAAFFDLRSGLLGEVVQKIVNYRMQLAVVGDVSSHIAASNAFRDFVVECERTSTVIFAPDAESLEARLSSKAGAGG